MISDLDLWRAADILLKRCGAEAPTIADQRADEMLAIGNTEGHPAVEASPGRCQ